MLSSRCVAGFALATTCYGAIVNTAFGPVHDRCVISLPSGSTIVERNGEATIVYANGSDMHLGTCAFEPRPRRRTAPAAAGDDAGSSTGSIRSASGPPVWNGWPQHLWFGLSWASWTKPAFPSNAVVHTFNASWVVPPFPADTSGNASDPWGGYAPTLSWWIGIQGPAVLQPVLEFNGLLAGQYDAVSWNCCPGGFVWHSDPILTQPGDTIVGSMVLTAPPAAGKQGGTYTTITTVIPQGGKGQPNSTVLVSDTDGEGDWLGNWAEVVTESYFVTQCGQLPCTGQGSSPGEMFSNLTMLLVNISSSEANTLDSSAPVPWTPATVPWTQTYEIENQSPPPGPPICQGTTSTNDSGQDGWANVVEDCTA